MVPASVQGHDHLRRWLCLVAVVACVGQAGCARLAGFRKPASPAFGTETTARDGDSSGRSTSGDLYADMVGKPKPEAEPAARPRAVLAENDDEQDRDTVASRRPRPTEPAGPKPDAEDKPTVALAAPVTLPAFSESSESLTAVSNHLGSGGTHGWRAESRSRAESSAKAVEPAPAASGPTIDSLLAQCRQKLDGLSAYQVKMNHQERVGVLLNPAEDVVLSVRRNPKAVRLEWQEGPHKGREVLYAANSGNGQMHVRMGEGLLAAPRLSMAPDSPLALKNGRHPITEAGFDTVVANMEEGLKKQKAGDASAGKIAYVGLEKAEGLDKPCHKITRELPNGEHWVVYLDPDNGLPAFVQATAGNGDLLERYVFRNLNPNVPELAKTEAFDPDARWGAPTGILQRLARGSATTGDAPKTR